MKLNRLLPMALLSLAAFGLGSVRDNAATLNSLIEQWPKRDGALTFELSRSLSESLVSDDRLFFQVMNQHRDLFAEWLEDLPSRTFTAFEPSQRPSLEKLKKRMTASARRQRSDTQHGDLARALLAKLRHTKIREID